MLPRIDIPNLNELRASADRLEIVQRDINGIKSTTTYIGIKNKDVLEYWTNCWAIILIIESQEEYEGELKTTINVQYPNGQMMFNQFWDDKETLEYEYRRF